VTTFPILATEAKTAGVAKFFLELSQFSRDCDPDFERRNT